MPYMQKLKEILLNKKIGLPWLALVLMSGIFYGLVLAPKTTSLEMMNKQVVDKQRQYEINLQANSVEARYEKLQKLVVAQDQLDQYVTVQEAISNLTLEIGRLASQNHLKSFASKEITGQPFEKIPNCATIGDNYIEVSFNADFPQFAMFLNELERQSPVIMTDKFSIKPSSKPSQANQVNMNLAVLVTQKNLRQPLDDLLESNQLTRESIQDQSETSLANRKVINPQ